MDQIKKEDNKYLIDNPQGDDGSIYQIYPNRIKRATGKHNFEQLNQQDQQERFAEDVYHVVDDELNYIVYERKQPLLDMINSLKYHQQIYGLEDYKEDLYEYFGKGRVNKEDKIRRILNFNSESYLHERSFQNNQIKALVDYRQTTKRFQPNKVDQWGFTYSSNERGILVLPAVFKYNKSLHTYEVQGQLCKQIGSFPLEKILSGEIEKLVTYFSSHLKQIHHTFKEMTYDNMLFHDTKQYVNFDKEIHAIISINEITISPNQTYEGPLHTEGISPESILYSCVYIPQQSQGIQEAFITFQRSQQNTSPHAIIDNLQVMQQIQLAKSDLPISLGKTALKEDMMIIFPNCNLHKVSFKNPLDQVLTRIVLTIQVVNNIDQPYSVNDYQFQYKHGDSANNIAYRVKKHQIDNIPYQTQQQQQSSLHYQKLKQYTEFINQKQDQQQNYYSQYQNIRRNLSPNKLD